MTKRFVLAATLLLMSFAGSAIADGGNKIAIGFHFPANNQGSFAMVGAGDAHGNAEVLPGGQVYPDPDGNGQRIRTTKVLHFPGGDVFMSTDGTFIATATTRESSGRWTFTGGTGIYANVSGGGKYHFFRILATGNLAGAYSGKIKLDDEDDGSDD